MADNNDKKKPGLAIMIGIGKEPKNVADKPPVAANAGAKDDPKKKANPFAQPKKKGATKPGPADKQSAIAKRLASLNGGMMSTNDNAGNASGGLPGM